MYKYYSGKVPYKGAPHLILIPSIASEIYDST